MTSTRFPVSLSLSLFVVSLASTLACVDNHPLEQACPCQPGWTCDDTQNVCVKDTAPGNGPGPSGTAGQGGVAGAGVAGAGVGGAGGAAGAAVVTVDTTYPDGCQMLLPPANAMPGQLVSGCPCTRRPGPGNSTFCPEGGNESAAAVIGPAGGTLMIEGQQGKASGVAFTVDIPPGALAAPTMLTVTETDLSPPADFVDVSPVYRLGPLGVTFSKLVSLRVPTGGGFVMGNGFMSVPNGAVYESDAQAPCTFESRADSYTNAGFLQASITATGYIFAGSPKTADLAACP